MKSKEIKLIGYDMISDHPEFNRLNPGNDGRELIKNKKLRRFYAMGTEKGLISTRRALRLSGLNMDDPTIKFGLYATQYGYLHPMPAELLAEAGQKGVKDENEMYQTIWASEQINPFIITLTLSNNLLGVLSLELGLQGDCASFLRGNIGLLSAFNEAELSLSSGAIDYALVVASGMGTLAREPQQSDVAKTFVEFGVTFILTSDEEQRQKNDSSVDIASLCRLYREGNYSAETIHFIKDITERMTSRALIESFH
ncbi:hypothetical protein Xbed_02718 [Xenorhabdus beddingii]|uniref:Beta-ketoacyl synthase N-terminal domain-containing protein n=1 Tax=Xenorhabdus beddingii TaxID=40578 RepID=A0A1Y2SJL0_9GAMM|nr:hypothetical protein [Xenorhabdus beddingii]OTA19023.1 hypothetical protein Xbed_02718 [Xenorhabdus beddingii]